MKVEERQSSIWDLSSTMKLQISIIQSLPLLLKQTQFDQFLISFILFFLAMRYS